MIDKLSKAVFVIFLITSCDFMEDASDVYTEITTNKLWTETMAPRNKFEKVYEIDFKNKEPKRFDIIEFKYEDEYFDKTDFYSNNQHVSRVIGLPNETIQLINGKVFINNRRLKEPFLIDSCMSKDNFPITKIEPETYFVMVDNRKMILADTVIDQIHKPYDSRKIGLVYNFQIVGVTNLK